MSTVNTNVQIPSESILDLFGKQTYLGNSFTVTTDSVALADTAEHPVLYVANASTNTKTLFNYVRALNCPDPAGTIIYRVYFNPTTVTAGSAATPVNCRTGSATASVATAKTSPAVVTKGTRVDTLTIGFSAQSIDSILLAIDPGTSLLITAQAVGGATTAIVSAAWYEL